MKQGKVLLKQITIMKEYLKSMLTFGAARYISVIALLLWSCSSIVLTGCKKDRLFTHIDSTAAVPSQFHFFNSYSYDNALSFSVDGLPRENVNQYTFSAYYPSSSAFNLNTAIANSKLINVNDPINTTLYANQITNNTFQFKPNTSYVVFVTNSSYDTVSSPLKTNIPVLNYYPEDVNHPFDGTTGVRVFNCVAFYGSPNIEFKMTPDVGQGTSAFLYGIVPSQQPATAASTYTSTQPGVKTITVTLTSTVSLQLSYLPIQLDNSKNYSFFVVGDIKNYFNGIQPLPRTFVTEDGNPSSLKELTLSSASIPSNASTTAQVTVVNDAYNIPGIIGFGSPVNGTLVQYEGLDVQLNQTKVNVKRWPIFSPPGGADIEDYNDINSMYTSAYPLNLLQRTATASSLAPGPYQINVVPGNAFSPTYGTFNYNFQQGLSYTLCLLPNNTSASKCGALIVENDINPNNSFFKLRFINVMGGTTQVDIHTDSPSGPIIAGGVAYGQDNAYIDLAPSLLAKNLYVTAAGSTTPLFQTGAPITPISLAFKPGNSGTIYLMGLLPGTTPYSGDSAYFGPYVYYHSDAYSNANTVLASSQLYF